MTEEQLLNDGYRKYAGEKIDVFFSLERCQHAAKCVGGAPKVFNTKRKPWILPDEETADKVAEVIERCPSGALQYIRNEE